MQRHTVPAIAAAAVALLLTTACSSSDQAEARPEPTVTAATDDPTTETPAPDPENDGTVGLTADVEYEDGTQVSLDKFTRGTTGPEGYPENTGYVSFTIDLVNGTSATMDLAAVYVACQYGDEEQVTGEQIFDDSRGLGGLPSTHLRPGKSISMKAACELPKDETHVQIEIGPGDELETAVFVGEVE